MKYIKIKDTKALYAFKVDCALYCDLCETPDVAVIELEDENATQICGSCIEQLAKLAKTLKI